MLTHFSNACRSFIQLIGWGRRRRSGCWRCRFWGRQGRGRRFRGGIFHWRPRRRGDGCRLQEEVEEGHVQVDCRWLFFSVNPTHQQRWTKEKIDPTTSYGSQSNVPATLWIVSSSSSCNNNNYHVDTAAKIEEKRCDAALFPKKISLFFCDNQERNQKFLIIDKI